MMQRNGTFWVVVVLRYLFTAVGASAVLLRVLRPVWDVQLVGGRIVHVQTWAWQGPDLGQSAVVSSAVDWMAMLGPALGMAIGTLAWWRVGGRDLRRLRR